MALLFAVLIGCAVALQCYKRVTLPLFRDDCGFRELAAAMLATFYGLCAAATVMWILPDRLLPPEAEIGAFLNGAVSALFAPVGILLFWDWRRKRSLPKLYSDCANPAGEEG